MIFDKNRTRARELERKDPVRYAVRIAELHSSPEWWIRYWDRHGKPHDEKCPAEFQSQQLAERYYSRVTTGIDDSTHTMPMQRKTTLADMCAFFIEQKQKKMERRGKVGGYFAAKTLCKHIAAMIGPWTFDECRANPMKLQEHLDSLPELKPEWAPKTRWNYHKELRAVFSLWIKKNLLSVPNPMNAIDEPDPQTRVIDYVPTHEDYEAIVATGLVEGVRPDALRLIGAVRYSGLRINEILRLSVADCVLDPTDSGLPYVWVVISKQRREARTPLPIRRELTELLREQIAGRTEGRVWPWCNPPYKLLDVWETDEHGECRVKGSLYKLAGVKVPRPFHDFRKTVKMELQRKHLDKSVRKRMQGHKTDAMDDYYSWFQREDLEAAVADTYEGYRDQTVTRKGNGDPELA